MHLTRINHESVLHQPWTNHESANNKSQINQESTINQSRNNQELVTNQPGIIREFSDNLQAVSAELAPEEGVDEVDVADHIHQQQQLGQVEPHRPHVVRVQRAGQVARECSLPAPLITAFRVIKLEERRLGLMKAAQQARHL